MADNGTCCGLTATARPCPPLPDPAGGTPVRPAAASWPQAPSISVPRVSRTVTGMPRRASRSSNSCITPGSDAVHFEPGVGLSGIRFTCARWPASRPASASARQAWSLMSRISAYSIDTRRPVAAAYAHAASSTSATFHRRLTGTSSSRSASSGACSDTASRTGRPSAASLPMAGTSPTVETVTARREMPSPSGTGSVIRRTAASTRA